MRGAGAFLGCTTWCRVNLGVHHAKLLLHHANTLLHHARGVKGVLYKKRWYWAILYMNTGVCSTTYLFTHLPQFLVQLWSNSLDFLYNSISCTKRVSKLTYNIKFGSYIWTSRAGNKHLNLLLPPNYLVSVKNLHLGNKGNKTNITFMFRNYQVLTAFIYPR